MFDGIRLTFTDEAFVNNLANNQPTSTKRIIDADGSINIYTVEFKGLNIKMYPNGYVIIKGSLHKYFNGGKHNYNDFTIHDINTTIEMLKTDLNLKPELAIVSNLEFGVNIITSFAPNAFLNDLIRFKDRQFNTMQVQGNGNGRELYYRQYGVKIYNKGLQYGLSKNLLRIEKKITVMCALGYNKVYLKDLLNISLWKHCKAELLKLIDSITVNEPIAETVLNKQQIRVYNTLPNNAKWGTYCKNKKCRHRKAFNKIIATYGTVSYRTKIIALVTAKCDQLAK